MQDDKKIKQLVVLVAVACTGCFDFDALDRCSRERCAPPCVAEVSAGWSHTCARKSDGSVWCWGVNNAGQLGIGADVDATPYQATPKQVKVDQAISVATGDSHSCAVVDGGTVWCWGFNSAGQLGDGTNANVSIRPKQSLGVSDATVVTAGGETTCIVRRSGALACWGTNELGELGTGSTDPFSSTAVDVSALPSVTEVSAGLTHVCAVDPTGQLWCWGENNVGQLGDGTTAGPKRVPTKTLLNDVVHVSAGLHHTCAVKRDGSVWCFGRNLGQLGRGTTSAGLTPARAGTLTGVAQVALNGYELIGPHSHTCSRENAGAVSCWGSNMFSEIGNNASTTDPVLSPQRIDALPDAMLLTAGAKHTCAIRKNGSLWCWGANEKGQLGDGTVTERKLPAGTALACP